MYPTFVQVKDILFHAHFEEQEGMNETLYVSFRLSHMIEDELIMDVQQDEFGYLYTTSVEYFDAARLDTFEISEKFDEEELVEILKALLNNPHMVKELTLINWQDFKGCYAVKNWIEEE